MGNPITLEQALAATEPFVIVQNGKVLCGPLSLTDNSLTYCDASQINNYAYSFTLESAGTDGQYYLHLYNQEATPVSKGYVIASVWSHTYLAGSKTQEGDNSGKWTIAEVGEKLYSIRNVGVAAGDYNNKPNGNEGNRVEQGQGFLACTTSGYWANHVTIYNTSGTWQFYSLSTTTLTDADPVYYGWDSFTVDGGATKDDENQVVIDARGWAPYWATSGTWKFDTPFDASDYRYLVFFAKRNISKYGNGDNETGGCLLIKDNNGVTMRQDDYSKYNDVDYPNVPNGGFWMNRWGNQRAMALDLQWLANTDKYGDGSDCKSIDITKIKEVGVAGTFTIGGIFFTNTLPAFSAGDYKRSFDSFDKYGTICLPFNAVCCGAQLYEITGKTASGITLSEHEGVMEAGKPYFYKTLEAKKGDMNNETDVYFFKAGYTTAASPVENNGLIGTFSDINPLGSYDGKNFYVLSNNDLYHVDSNVKIGAYKAYIDKDKIVNKGGAAKILIDFNGAEDDATGITTLDVEKTLNSKFYDLSGREVKNPTSGIYIVNGKKVVIK